MKGIIRDNLVLCNQLMLNTDHKLKITLGLYPEDEEIKKILEERSELFLKASKKDFNGKDDNDGDASGVQVCDVNDGQNVIESETVNVVRLYVNDGNDDEQGNINEDNDCDADGLQIGNVKKGTANEHESVVEDMSPDGLPAYAPTSIAPSDATTNVEPSNVHDAKVDTTKVDSKKDNPLTEYHERKVRLGKPISEEQKNVAEYLWSTCKPVRYI